MAERKPRFNLGDTAPPAALADATEEKDYYSARVARSLINKLRQAEARDGFKQRHKHFTHMATEYLAKHHPDLL